MISIDAGEGRLVSLSADIASRDSRENRGKSASQLGRSHRKSLGATALPGRQAQETFGRGYGAAKDYDSQQDHGTERKSPILEGLGLYFA